MAKVTITFEDNNKGTVSMTCSFDPPIKKDAKPTMAQQSAVEFMGWIKKQGEVKTPPRVSGRKK